MARTIILAVGLTNATSTDIVIAQGQTVTVSMFQSVAGANDYPPSLTIPVFQATPGIDNLVTTLTLNAQQILLVGPGTFRAVRPATSGTPFGVFIET